MWRAVLILVIAMQTASADEPARKTCDADALEKAGDDAWAKGQQRRALDKYEKAVDCEPVEKRVFKAGIAACELYQHGRDEQLAKKAKRYYNLLRRQDNKDKLAQACTPRCRLED